MRRTGSARESNDFLPRGNGASNFLENVVIRLKALMVASVIATAGVAATAHAGGRVGIWFGGPLYYPVAPVPYYYYPPPPVVAVPAAPTTYVEQGQPVAAPAQPAGSWYYCDGSRMYYPYAKECPGGWREVPAQPPPPSN
ncbi:hypothetical protein GCM10010985_36200 [Caballeronia grimmiae]|uniref:Lipoprotein n=1 Tax=Caballeronia grimmiae TaxID=1071679 RepID=A0ABQ1RR66_9BURK|nr:hypothetical protein GCM10010985_36200 [Caballeronia grimmiae]